MSTEAISTLLAEAIAASITDDSNEFRWESFFSEWFRVRGTPCYFLFKKHLGVTNTQYVELFSLLQCKVVNNSSHRPVGQLIFHTTESLKATLSDTINSLLDIPKSRRRTHINRFAKLYAEVFGSTVAVDMFYCSCAVFLPPGLTLDVVAVCAQSGYIHSAGHSVYIRNIKKSRQQDLEQSIRHHLAKFPVQDWPLPFVVYAHEDFSLFDKDAREQISRGIDATKLYVEKMSMGAHRLAQVVQDIRMHFKKELEVPPPGSYKDHTFRGHRALWLVGDRAVSPSNLLNPGAARYYICYQQLAKNDSPFFLFDENKPAWKSHTTLPHSLTAALLNATMPHDSDTTIVDPFGGTGTTWFEARRIAPKASVKCSDFSHFSPILIADNLHFFLSSPSALQRLLAQLASVSEAIKRGVISEEQPSLIDLDEDGFTPIAAFDEATKLLEQLRGLEPKEEQEYKCSEDFARSLASKPFFTRFLFYIKLRAEFRYQGGYKRKSLDRNKAFQLSLEEIVLATTKFADLRANAEKGKHHEKDGYVSFKGKYSPVVIPTFLFAVEDGMQALAAREVFNRDARELEPNSAEIVICDPPYGFNTSEEISSLATLYSEFLDSAILSLRENGHLILVLPAESYTGRDLPYCTRSGLIASQILLKAEKLGRKLFLPINSVPNRLLRPPYYWEAERALRRTILHFRLTGTTLTLRPNAG